jgi:serine/threonine protein kinase
MDSNWVDKVLKEQYNFIKELKRSEKTNISVYRHKELNKSLVKRSIKGSGEVYMILKTLSHPNISNVYEAVKTENGVTVLEEFIDGQTVAEYLKDNLYTAKGVKTIISSLCDALSFLHSNKIIHKDIKPENVMIDNKGNVKLIDFDTARIYKHYQSQDTIFMGTIGYAPPEQYGLNQTDERTDIYSLGVLMNVMLTGELPEKRLYNGKLRKVIIKCTQSVPDNRYQTAEELKLNL